MERFNCPDLLTTKTYASDTRAPNLERAHAHSSNSHMAGPCCGGVRPGPVEGNKSLSEFGPSRGDFVISGVGIL